MIKQAEPDSTKKVALAWAPAQGVITAVPSKHSSYLPPTVRPKHNQTDRKSQDQQSCLTHMKLPKTETNKLFAKKSHKTRRPMLLHVSARPRNICDRQLTLGLLLY